MKLFKGMLLFCALSFYSTISGESQPVSSSSNQIFPILRERFSGRSYDASRSVTKEQIRLLAEAAHLAPSCYNDQPWRFIICDRTTNPEAYKKVFDCLVEFNQGWAKNAPVLVIVTAHTKFSRNQEPNRWGPYDTGAAAMSMMLQASSMGLMAHQMGGFDEKKIQTSFSIPTDYIPMSVMAVGYPTLEESTTKQVKDRKPIDDQFFLGAWNKGFKSL